MTRAGDACVRRVHLSCGTPLDKYDCLCGRCSKDGNKVWCSEDDKDESLALVPYVPPEPLQVQEIDNEATRKYRRERLKREARKKEAQLKKGLEDKQ